MNVEFSPRPGCDTEQGTTDGVATAYLSYGELGNYTVRYTDENKLDRWATGVDLTKATVENDESMNVLVCPHPRRESDRSDAVTGTDVRHIRMQHEMVRIEYASGEITEYDGMYIAGVESTQSIPSEHRQYVNGVTPQDSQ